MKTAKKLPKCVACERPIPDQESDVMLRRADSAERVFYHTRCAAGAMVEVMREPNVWIMTVRHADGQFN